MPYNKDLDKEKYSKNMDFGDSKITVSVFSYNNAEAKLQVSRQIKRASGDWIFAKLGRMSKDEVEAIIPLIQNALKEM